MTQNETCVMFYEALSRIEGYPGLERMLGIRAFDLQNIMLSKKLVPIKAQDHAAIAGCAALNWQGEIAEGLIH